VPRDSAPAKDQHELAPQGAFPAWGFPHHGSQPYPPPGRAGEAIPHLECYERSFGLFRQLGDLHEQSEVLTHIGDARLALGDMESARRAWQEALAILDGLHPADAAQVRARLHSLSSADGAPPARAG